MYDIPVCLHPLYPISYQTLLSLQERLRTIPDVSHLNHVKTFIQDEITDIYSQHASSTHSVLYAEYKLMYKLYGLMNNTVVSSLDELQMILLNYQRVVTDTLEKNWSDYRTPGGGKVMNRNRRDSLEKYVLTWGKKPYLPFDRYLETLLNKLALKLHEHEVNELVIKSKPKCIARFFGGGNKTYRLHDVIDHTLEHRTINYG